MNGKGVLVALSFALGSAAASERSPAALDGASLLVICTAEKLAADGDELFCHGYIQGVHDALSDGLCVPPGIDRAAIASIVMRFIADHREARSMHAASVVLAVLMKRFPC